MREGLESWVRALAAAGLFTGAVITLAPGGKAGKTLRLVCALLLMAVLLSPLGRMDFSACAEELSRQRLLGSDLSGRGEQEALRLLGSIIQERTEAYILDKAAQLEVPAVKVRVTLVPGEEVPWPWSAELWLKGPGEEDPLLAEVMEGELGIPRTRQVWHADTRN